MEREGKEKGRMEAKGGGMGGEKERGRRREWRVRGMEREGGNGMERGSRKGGGRDGERRREKVNRGVLFYTHALLQIWLTLKEVSPR